MLIKSPSGRLLTSPTGVLLITGSDTQPSDGPFDRAVFDPTVFDA